MAARVIVFSFFQKEEDVERSLWWEIIWYSDIAKGDEVFVTVINQKSALKVRLVFTRVDAERRTRLKSL